MRRGRYAPSPTGPQHAGNLRTALLGWLQARLSDAEFVLRIEDIDEARSVPGSQAEILRDLEWMGIDWDAGPTTKKADDSYVQSTRYAVYEEALASLRERDLIYPCWCSRKDIAEASSAPHSAGSVYPGTCAKLDEFGRNKMRLQKNDRAPAYRLRVPEDMHIVLEDEIQGRFEQKMSDVGDFVLKRSDGYWAYQFAVVVDDLMMGITDVVRGIDLLDSTPRQILLSKCLSDFVPDAQEVKYWHVPLLSDEAGERMSKRTATEAVDRTQNPEMFVGWLARTLGWEEGDVSARELLHRCSLERIRNLKEVK